MPRLRDLPKDFVQRRRGFRTPQASLEQGRNTGALLADYSVACRAGRAVMSVIRPLGLPIDFSTGRGVRVEDGKIVFVVDNSTQLSRLRNLQIRITQRLLTEGVPLTGVEFRLRAHNLKAAEESPASIAIRTPSLVAAAELEAGVATLVDADLREQLRALARIMAPTPAELPLALINTLTEEQERLHELSERLKELIVHLPPAPDRKIIFSLEEVAGDKALTEMRERMLVRRARRDRFDQIVESVQKFLVEAPTHIDELLQCALSPELPLPAWVKSQQNASLLTLLSETTEPSKASAAQVVNTCQQAEELSRMKQLALGAVELSRQIVRGKQKLNTAIQELKQDFALARRAASDVSTPSEVCPTPALQTGGSLEELRKALRLRDIALTQTAKTTRKIVEKALQRIPPAGTLEASDKRVAAEVARVAMARSKGEVHPEDHFSADSARQLLLWDTRERLETRLQTLDHAITALLDRLAADRKVLLTQRSSKRSSGSHALSSMACSASALVSDFSALREIDRRRTQDEEELSRLSAESETLSDSVDILLAGLPNEDYVGESPEKASLEAASLKIDERIKTLTDLLGGRPNLQLIPSQEEAANDATLAQCRKRLLNRLEEYAEAQTFIHSATEALTSFRRVLRAPRQSPLDAHLIEGLKHSLQDVLDKVEAARAVVAPELPALPDRDALLGVPQSVFSSPSENKNSVAVPETTERSPSLLEKTPSVAEFPPTSSDTLEAEAMLMGFSSMIALWKTQRPNIVDERLIPTEADAAKSPQIKRVRVRQLARKERRQALDEMLNAFEATCLNAQALLNNTNAEKKGLAQCLQDLEKRADQISALLEKPLLSPDTTLG